MAKLEQPAPFAYVAGLTPERAREAVYGRDPCAGPRPRTRRDKERVFVGAEFYAIEAGIRGASPEQHLAERQTRVPGRAVRGSRSNARGVSTKSRLGEKLTYIARHWDGLRVFLEDGRVEMDTNCVANLIRPVALNRKNASFALHEEGATAWGRIAPLMETAKLNGVDSYGGGSVTFALGVSPVPMAAFPVPPGRAPRRWSVGGTSIGDAESKNGWTDSAK